MNKVIVMGRLAKDPEVRHLQIGNETKSVAKYSLAVDRRGSDNVADFISVTAWEKAAEFAEKYLHKGMKVLVTGRLQTGSYTNKDGAKVYTTDVVAEDQEFCEKKTTSNEPTGPVENRDFENVDIEDDLPFGDVTR